jgi:DNA modification methylase
MNIFSDFNFNNLNSPEFKEDSVREILLKPLLDSLGYSGQDTRYRIIRSKTLTHPFVTIGSNRKRKIKSIPDYLMQVEDQFVWVLDAKAPDQSVLDEAHREQVYFYAIHPDVRVPYYGICNGYDLIIYRVDKDDAVLFFPLPEIEKHWNKVVSILGPDAFENSKETDLIELDTSKFDYMGAKPLGEIKVLKKQSAKRHYGVHGYFTKQVWNVVQAYIENFTKPGDVVLDPYGGSGVTAIEALIIGRKAIYLDINPLAVFLVKNLIAPVKLNHVAEAFVQVRDSFAQHRPESKAEIKEALLKYPYPKGNALPKNSDVETVEQLFSKKQLAQLAYLKFLIHQVDDEDVRGILMLVFSGLLNQINLTYHASKGRSAGRGNSSVFQYYRYRIAPKPSMLEILPRFELRYKKVIAAKKELAPLITKETLQNAIVQKGSATDLKEIKSESVDYIYTDPPYGSKIAYLDLSTMWNAWLDLDVTNDDRDIEVIEGGEANKSREEYFDLLALSMCEMFRVLKFNRWMSFVFAHKDPHYWHKVINSAERAGFEYAGSVKQASGKTTYKKRQNPFRVIEGQLIINFKKVKNPQSIMRVDLGADISDIVIQTIEGIVVKNNGATLEEINDELILRGLEMGFLDILSNEYQDISPFLEANFDYDEKSKKFHIRENRKIKSQIDVRLRIRYYLISYLRRSERQGIFPTSDEIVWYIMPLLKNGETPKNQTILKVLEEIATPFGENRWRLSSTDTQIPLL